jgi:hypothetical protein
MMEQSVILMSEYPPMVFELFPEKAPLTVANFTAHTNSGFETLDAIAELPASGLETWNKPLRMPQITSIRVQSV